MKHLKTINELHQDTYDSYYDKRLYNYLLDNHPEIVRSELISMSNLDIDEIFLCVCEEGILEVVKMLLKDSRIDPSYYENYAIRAASEYGHIEVVKTLLNDPRVDPSDMDNYAIRWASRRDHLEVVRLLASDKRSQQESNISEEELLKKYLK